ncbi:MAG TPA: NADH-quinone oxidoreductase subunit J [Chloroflexota bacterium]
MELIYFFAVASIAVLAAIGVIASRNTVHSALLVVVNLFCVAMLYLSLSAEFLAVVQITVYAGAIMVLFLFVITMLDTSRGETRNLLANRTPIAVGFALAFLVVVLAVLQPGLTPGGAPVQASAGSNLQALGDEIFKSYVLPFELASLLLLVAMVAAMVLGKRRA